MNNCRGIMDAARAWVETSPDDIIRDAERLGLVAASEYNMELAMESLERGDDRWSPLAPHCDTTEAAMAAAIGEEITRRRADALVARVAGDSDDGPARGSTRD